MARNATAFHQAILALISLVAALRGGLAARDVFLADAVFDPLRTGLPLSLAIALPLILLLPRMPVFLRAPARWRHLPGTLILPAAVVLLASVMAAMTLRAAGLASTELGALNRALDLALPVLFLALLATATGAIIVARQRAPKVGAPPAGPTALPDIGIMMKAYIVTDWVLLRLCGAGLLGMAWMIRDIGDPARLVPILHGAPAHVAMYAYAGLGVFLAVPVLLPHAVSRPATIAGGAVKAAILLGLSLLFMPALDLAVDLYVPNDYRAALHEAVPKVFKGIAGIALFSTMAVAFFRQLGGAPQRLDGMGNPAYRPSTDELRRMRAARMHG